LSLGQQASAVTLVENLSQTNDAARIVASGGWRGSSFTTGSGAYNLNSATLWFGQGSPTSNTSLFLRLYSNNSGTPGTLITTFTNPTLPLPTTFANTTFTLATPQSLTANTTYWLVSGILSGPGSYNWGYTNSTAQTGLPGWSIGDNYATSNNQGSSWTTNSTSLRFSLEGTEQSQSIPEPSSLVALLGLGGLGLVSSLKKRK
jgi:hypothetical protein